MMAPSNIVLTTCGLQYHTEPSPRGAASLDRNASPVLAPDVSTCEETSPTTRINFSTCHSSPGSMMKAMEVCARGVGDAPRDRFPAEGVRDSDCELVPARERSSQSQVTDLTYVA